MKILAFDSSNEPLSVAVVDQEKILTEQTLNIKRNHSIQLMPAIEEALRQAQITLADIDRIAVASGPGSYTGLRIAATVAKSLAWAQDIELVGVSSLKVLAANSYPEKDGLIVPLLMHVVKIFTPACIQEMKQEPCNKKHLILIWLQLNGPNI